MTKAVGPKHKPDLWKVRAKSQVFSTAGLCAPPSSISFLSFMITPFLSLPLPLLLSPPIFFQSILSLCRTVKKIQKGLIKVLDTNERSREKARHRI